MVISFYAIPIRVEQETELVNNQTIIYDFLEYFDAFSAMAHGTPRYVSCLRGSSRLVPTINPTVQKMPLPGLVRSIAVRIILTT
jgi:hypothetical protein